MEWLHSSRIHRAFAVATAAGKICVYVLTPQRLHGIDRLAQGVGIQAQVRAVLMLVYVRRDGRDTDDAEHGLEATTSTAGSGATGTRNRL